MLNNSTPTERAPVGANKNFLLQIIFAPNLNLAIKYSEPCELELLGTGSKEVAKADLST